MAEPNLPDDGLTLAQLADLIHRLRPRRIPWMGLPVEPQDCTEADRVVRVVVQVDLADGRRVEIEGSGERLNARIDVRYSTFTGWDGGISPTRIPTGEMLATLSVFGDINGPRVQRHRNAGGRPPGGHAGTTGSPNPNGEPTVTDTPRTRAARVTQWWENGDHPDDGVGQPRHDPITGDTYDGIEGAVVRFFRDPAVPGASLCDLCCLAAHDHGWIDSGGGGQRVCPGDLVVTGRDGTHRVVRLVDVMAVAAGRR